MSAISGAAQHRHPEDPPTEQAEDCDQIDDPLCRSQLDLFGLAARLQDLVEGLDLPAHRIPVELFDGGIAGTDGQVGDELAVDRVPALRCIAFGGMKDREQEWRIQLLFRNGSEHPDASITKLQNGLAYTALLIAHLDSVQSFKGSLHQTSEIVRLYVEPVADRSYAGPRRL